MGSGRRFVCISSASPLPFFTVDDVTTGDRQVVCRELTPLEMAKLTWRGIRFLKYLERVPIIP